MAEEQTKRYFQFLREWNGKYLSHNWYSVTGILRFVNTRLREISVEPGILSPIEWPGGGFDAWAVDTLEYEHLLAARSCNLKTETPAIEKPILPKEKANETGVESTTVSSEDHLTEIVGATGYPSPSQLACSAQHIRKAAQLLTNLKEWAVLQDQLVKLLEISKSVVFISEHAPRVILGVANCFHSASPESYNLWLNEDANVKLQELAELKAQRLREKEIQDLKCVLRAAVEELMQRKQYVIEYEEYKKHWLEWQMQQIAYQRWLAHNLTFERHRNAFVKRQHEYSEKQKEERKCESVVVNAREIIDVMPGVIKDIMPEVIKDIVPSLVKQVLPTISRESQAVPSRTDTENAKHRYKGEDLKVMPIDAVAAVGDGREYSDSSLPSSLSSARQASLVWQNSIGTVEGAKVLAGHPVVAAKQITEDSSSNDEKQTQSDHGESNEDYANTFEENDLALATEGEENIAGARGKNESHPDSFINISIMHDKTPMKPTDDRHTAAGRVDTDLGSYEQYENTFSSVSLSATPHASTYGNTFVSTSLAATTIESEYGNTVTSESIAAARMSATPGVHESYSHIFTEESVVEEDKLAFITGTAEDFASTQFAEAFAVAAATALSPQQSKLSDSGLVSTITDSDARGRDDPGSSRHQVADDGFDISAGYGDTFSVEFSSGRVPTQLALDFYVKERNN